MAIVFNSLFGTAQSKTAGTSLNINPADITVAAADDIFLAYAGDDVGSAFGVTHGGTASITWTLEKENIFATNAKAQLWRGLVTAGGTLTDITISWTTNVTAKAAVAGWFSGVGTLRNTAGGHNGVSPYHYIATTTDEAGWVEDEISAGWFIGDLVVGTGAVESTSEAAYTGVTAGATWASGPTVVGSDSTIGAGAASNMTAVLSFGIASSDETTASAARIGADNGNNRDNASAGAIYSPSVPKIPNVMMAPYIAR